MTILSNQVSPSPSSAGRAKPRSAVNIKFGPLAGSVPFFIYIGIFLLLPTLIMTAQAFLSEDGDFTTRNLAILGKASTLNALNTSLIVSALSSLFGVVFGGLAAYALILGSDRSKLLRRIVLSLSSVLAQFGGVMLAFAFLATIGRSGIVTEILTEIAHALGNTGFKVDPTWLQSIPGLVTVYSYFQIPLMILVFIPALDGIRPQWREANAVFGGSSLQYWKNIGLPILTPSILGSFLLLFANSFSAYATAAALFDQKAILIPMKIKDAYSNELDSGLSGQASVLATLMIVIVAVIMTLNLFLTKRSEKWVK